MLNTSTQVPKLLLRLLYEICRAAEYYLCGRIDLSGKESNSMNKDCKAKWDLFSIFAGRRPCLYERLVLVNTRRNKQRNT